MELRVNFKPTKKTSRYKPEIDGIFTISSSGRFRVSYDHKTAILVNFVKFRQKTKQTKNKQGTTDSVILRKKHWVAYTYRIPVDLIRAMGLRIEQNSQNFKISCK